MKKLIVIAIAMLLTSCLMAQPGGNHHNNPQHPQHQQGVPAQHNPQHHHAPNPQHPQHQIHSLAFTAAHGEEFVLYVDGDIVNKKAASYVLVQNLTPHIHDIYVVLKRPKDKITMMRYQPKMPVENFLVLYNAMNGMLELAPMQPQTVTPQMHASHVCTFEEVERMYNTLRNESFDETRLSMAKNMVANNKMSAHQIKHLAESFTFEDNKLSFLKYAYTYCVDQKNYYECVDVLTFSSNKEALLRYINH